MLKVLAIIQLALQRDRKKAPKRGEGPLFFFPPLLIKERGIKGVRLILKLTFS
jgi:hypothetical protein